MKTIETMNTTTDHNETKESKDIINNDTNTNHKNIENKEIETKTKTELDSLSNTISEINDTDNSSEISSKLSSKFEINSSYPSLKSLEIGKIGKKYFNKSKSFDLGFKKMAELNEVSEDKEEDIDLKEQLKHNSAYHSLHVSFEKANIDNLSNNLSIDGSRTPKLKKLMFPVLEENEDEIKKEFKLYSPRVKVYSDKLEDFTISSSSVSKFKHSQSHFRDCFQDQTEVIAEDNNENIVETEKIHKRSNLSKLLESAIDKTEAIDNFNDLIIDDLEEQITEAIEEDPEDDENAIFNQIKHEKKEIKCDEIEDDEVDIIKKRNFSINHKLIDISEEIKEEKEVDDQKDEL